MNNKKEVKQRIKNLENELALLKASIECPTHPPQKLPYSIDVLVDKIVNNTLPEDLVVGDYIDVELYTGEVVRFYVVGTECDKNGSKTLDYTFGTTFVDLRLKMNDDATNTTSWKESKMRKVYLPRLMRLLPKSLQDNIAPVTKYTSAGNQSKRIIETEDKLFLFSEVEIYGKTSLSHEGEGKQYPFFEDKENRKIENYPWLRSPSGVGSHSFCYVYDAGGSYYYNANYSTGVAFGFCLSSKNQ